MDKLLKLAALSADQAEIYYQEESDDELSYSDSKVDKAESKISSGIALRIIKDGRLGFAHTRNLLDPEALVKQAVLSSQEGMKVSYDFPAPSELKQLATHDPSIAALNKMSLVERAEKLISYISQKTDAQLNLGFEYGMGKSGIMNTSGVNYCKEVSGYAEFAMLIFPGTGSGLHKWISGKGREDISWDAIDEMINLYEISKNEIVPQTKKMPVIFADSSASLLLSRFSVAASPENIYNKVSPLVGKLGQHIVSPKLSLWQDPHDDTDLGATAFDGEGTPTQKMYMIENGVFRNIPLDLNYAAKLKMQPTGNGIRYSLESQPSAGSHKARVGLGAKSLNEMISSINEGLIVQSLMGGHSGNVLNGDYSVGVATGFYIQKGKIVARVKDCMISGNAYESLSNIVDIENKYSAESKIPTIMIDGISVAGK